MRYTLLLISIILVLNTFVNAQDKNSEAIMRYTMAEEYYNRETIDGYLLCINELGKAEEKLGSTNAKILELKIKALSKYVMNTKEITGLYTIDSCFNKFFSLADPKIYPQEKYIQMMKLKDEIESYKSSINTDYKQIYQKDNTLYGDIYALFNLYTNKMKNGLVVPYVSSTENINAANIIADSIQSLFVYHDKNYYALPFKTGSKGGYLFWFFSIDINGFWYMAFKDLEEQRTAIKNNATNFFKDFDINYLINLKEVNKKKSKWQQVIIQSSDILLKPNTDYYIFFSSSSRLSIKETKSIPIFYSIYLTNNTAETKDQFFKNKANNNYLRK